MTRSALIVGGGIGGLATAIALDRRGWRVEVCERAAEFTEIGAGLSLWPNALRALQALDVDLAERVQTLGSAQSGGGVRTSSGRWLARSDAAEIERSFGLPLVVLHRADLVRALIEALPPEVLRPSTTVSALHDDGNGVVVEHDHGSRRVDLVVGADGLHSTVRRLRWPEAKPLRYAGYTAWRMITDVLPQPLTAGAEVWGRGERFGFTTMPGGRSYCFATATAPAGGTSPEGEWAQLNHRFRTWPDPIPALLDAVPADRVLRHDIYDLPPLPSYVSSRVVLIGDAAHAMTPNLGQGACQALEDAVTLAACLDGSDGLTRFDQERRPRTQLIARRSALLGTIGQLSWPPAAIARDLAARLTPDTAALRSMTPILSWKP